MTMLSESAEHRSVNQIEPGHASDCCPTCANRIKETHSTIAQLTELVEKVRPMIESLTQEDVDKLANSPAMRLFRALQK